MPNGLYNPKIIKLLKDPEDRRKGAACYLGSKASQERRRADY
jgi:hypothetical protein